MRVKLRDLLEPAAGILLFALALWILHHVLREYHYHDIVREVAALPPDRLGAAVALTIVSYLVLPAYDALAIRYIGQQLGYGKIALASFISYAFSNNVGLAALTGGSLRYRLYSAWGLTAAEVGRVVAFCVVTFWLGLLAVGGLAFVLEPLALPGMLRLPLGSVRPLGGAFLALLAAYVAVTALRRTPLAVRGWEFPVPSVRLAAAQIAVASIDWALAAGVLYLLLPPAPGLSYAAFVPVYLLGLIAGLVSHVPGGLGVFETVVLYFLVPRLPASAVLGSLVVYRLVYYLLPLGGAVVLLGTHELLERREATRRAARIVGRWVPALVPHVLAFTTFAGGAVLLASGALPATGWRLEWLHDLVPLPVMELSHFLGSVVGVGLLLLARGLQQRLDAAYFLTAVLLGAGIVLSLLKGFDYEEAAVLATMLGGLLPARRHFYRRAALITERFTPGWIAAIVLVLTGAIWLGLFAHKHVEYSGDLWWRFALSEDAPRFLRASVGAVGTALVLAAAALLRRAPAEPARPGPTELERARAVIATSGHSTANLALLGDKALLFNDAGTAFVMYAVEGRTWVAMGHPVGPDRECVELAWRFRELCDRHDGWAVFYEVGRENLPLYVDLGLTLLKLGEEARVALGAFTLEGGARKTLRQAHHRLEREGLAFEVVPPAAVPQLLPELRRVSDAWLADKQTREKGFSLGFFEPGYVARFPVALARRAGTIVAFANLWLAAERAECSVDLMRHLPEAPNGVMDFLFVEIMLWAKGEGYRWFNFGMAPLSGLESRPFAPLWTRLGALIYRHGEDVYNFQGVRQYKEKFGPQWEPRYLACPGGLALPRILVNLATLISGGLKGIVAK